MESMDVFMQLIGTVGFPIVAYIGLFWYVIQQNKAHQNEVAELRKAIENNTQVMNKVLERM